MRSESCKCVKIRFGQGSVLVLDPAGKLIALPRLQGLWGEEEKRERKGSGREEKRRKKGEERRRERLDPQTKILTTALFSYDNNNSLRYISFV